MSGFADFPLAKGLSAVVNPLISGIVDGTGSVLLDQVTPVTSELLRFWFQQDYCDTRELNFHVGQRAAILNIIYAHEVLGARQLRDLYETVRLTMHERVRAAIEKEDGFTMDEMNQTDIGKIDPSELEPNYGQGKAI